MPHRPHRRRWKQGPSAPFFCAKYAKSPSKGLFAYLAEREGFEPSIRLTVYTLSRRAPSTTRPPLQIVFQSPHHVPVVARRKGVLMRSAAEIHRSAPARGRALYRIRGRLELLQVDGNPGHRERPIFSFLSGSGSLKLPAGVARDSAGSQPHLPKARRARSRSSDPHRCSVVSLRVAQRAGCHRCW
jgi:hypothetical protein